MTVKTILLIKLGVDINIRRVIPRAYSPVNIRMNLEQIATEGFLILYC